MFFARDGAWGGPLNQLADSRGRKAMPAGAFPADHLE